MPHKFIKMQVLQAKERAKPPDTEDTRKRFKFGGGEAYDGSNYGTHGGVVVEALYYKPESRGFDSR
jgi:hypothetical protein